MTRRIVLPIALLATAAAWGCGKKEKTAVAVSAASVPALRGVQANPPAPVTAGALSRVPDSPAAQRRIGFVDLDRLGEVDDVLPPATVLKTVLRQGAARVAALPAGAARTAIQVGSATVVRGPQLPRGTGVQSGDDGAILGGSTDLVRTLQDSRPPENVVSVRGAAVMQTCLGETVAQTSVRALKDADRTAESVGVALRTSVDPPAGVQLVICYAPRLLRQVDRAVETLERTYGDVASGDRKPVIAEEEYGEDTAVTAALPADALPAGEVRRLLAGGEALLKLLPR